MFTIEYHFNYLNGMPGLRAPGNFFNVYEAQERLVNRVVYKDDHDTLFIADNLDDLVQFGVTDNEGKNWSSRVGIFNTHDESVSVVSVVCASWVQHFQLSFIQGKIAEATLDIGFIKVELPDQEFYYIPFETVERQNVISKLERMYSVEIHEVISPNNDREFWVAEVINPPKIIKKDK